MFGYIVCDRAQLSEDDRARYRAVYCGLCSTLADQYGRSAQAALNYDMTFLAVLLGALYEPEEQVLLARCLPHPLHRQNKVKNSVIEYCADMTVILAYYNALDNWQDDRSVPSRLYAARLERAVRRVRERYPEKSAVIKSRLDELARIEKAKEKNLDAAAGCFGALLGEIFCMRQDHWAESLYHLGDQLGRFIYFMDAYEDAEKDAHRNRYNPLLQLRGQADYEQTVKQILTSYLAAAAAAFEGLPIVRDARILRNILYAGAWSKYMILQEKKK